MNRAAPEGAWSVSSLTHAELAGDQSAGRGDPVQPFARASSASPELIFSTLTVTQRPPTRGLPASYEAAKPCSMLAFSWEEAISTCSHASAVLASLVAAVSPPVTTTAKTRGAATRTRAGAQP